jgi:hypothetical protein
MAMIRVSTADTNFNRAWCNAHRELPVETLERPRQYGQRWREAYRCRVDPTDSKLGGTYYIFDRDEDYTWFMLRWG